MVAFLFILWSLFVKKKEDMPGFNCVCYCIYLALIISCLISHIVFLPRITKYDISGYDCSDSITNEFIRKENEDNAKQVRYIQSNFYIDVFQIVANCVILIVGLVLNKTGGIKEEDREKRIEQYMDEIKRNKDIFENENDAEIPLNTY